MSDRPAQWVETALGDLNEFIGSTIDPSKFPDEKFELYSVPSFPSGKPECLQGRDIGSSKQTVKYNDVLISKINPRINRVWIVGRKTDKRQIASSEWIVVRSAFHEAHYLRHFFTAQNFRDQLCADVTGVGGSLTRAQPKRVATFAVPIPPQPEQKCIADKLDTLLARIDACRDRLDRVPKIIKQFRQSVLAAATSGRLTEEWHNTTGAPNWETVRLGSVATSFSYGSAAKSAKTGDVPVLRMGNIQHGRLDWSDLVFTSDKAEISKYKLHPGDVLFNRTNSPELVGKTSVFKGEREAIYAGYLIRVRCGGSLLPDYLNYCLNSPAGRDYCWRVKSDGVSQSNINAKKLADFPFALPSINEQSEIVRRVDRLFSFADRLESRAKSASAKVATLTPATLAKAFRGELVPQDPNDEPASALLERIRAERAENPTAPRKRRTSSSK